ncbi:3-oxoacyl-[acyl-carrier-protein] synthase III C-terminal domain-containing protein [Kitasatospora sp. NPDC087314]|uniref:3-oxoacyl-[acyl-carrier-protein] synthase III C-terminal domain-containing protein n=1 Tax=Kitasatospora sp. NPDC087314 TaxID=3364068 RepID=UPI0037FB2290
MVTTRTGGAPAPLAVRAAAWHLPEHRVPVGELPEVAGLDAERRTVLAGLGIDTVAVDRDLGPTGLAERAARSALARAGLAAQDLSALIVVDSRAPETLLSSEATRLQARLGAEQAVTFGVGGLGCVSIGPALLAARGLLAADPDVRHVLVAHASTPATPGRYRHPVTVNGDAGQALLLARTGPARVLDLVQETNGAYWDLFRVDYRDRPWESWQEECRDLPGYSFRLAVETRNRLAALLDRLLKRHGLDRADIAGYASQNLSAGGLRFLAESLGVELLPECRENLARYGHLGPNDVFLNLWTALANGRLAEGDRVVLVNVSPVAAWNLLLVEIGPWESTA